LNDGLERYQVVHWLYSLKCRGYFKVTESSLFSDSDRWWWWWWTNEL